MDKFSLYPIGRVAKSSPRGVDEEDFDLSLLPRKPTFTRMVSVFI
jgi:hypothetical protein